MREVIVTAGARGSGKSTFCEKAIALDSSIVGVSRDRILMEIFGKTSLDPYSGGHSHAYQKMWEAVKEALAPKEVMMILDAWNGNSGERRSILKKLHDLGADRVIVWYFVTPVEVVVEWFWRKPDIAKISEMQHRQGEGLTFSSDDSPRQDHKLYYELASRIDFDGFDEVIRINPMIMGPEHILCLQTSLKL